MRKHKLVTIAAEGRDKGKTFLVVEKSAYDTEKWATRALLALSRTGADIPEDALAAGGLGVLIAGLTSFQKLAFEDAEPLLDEMMTCISFVPDANRLDPMTSRPFTRALMMPDAVNDGDIEEITTLLTLRGEALELHLGFSVTAALSSLATAVVTSNRQDTSTSPRPAEQPSVPDEQA
jgi:hypothetical protein